MKVFVYFNLHKKCWSVKALEGDRKGLVIAHTQALALEHCQFKVSEAGRQRVLAERRKNIHAGVVGYVTEGFEPGLCTNPISYNPYKAGHFYNKLTDEPVFHASMVTMNGRSVFTS